MNRVTGTIFYALLAFMTMVAAAQAAPAARRADLVDVAVMYSAQRAYSPVSSSSAFWMNGSTGELAIPAWRSLSAVAAVGGQHTNRIPGFDTGMGLNSVMGGLRWRVPTRTLFQPYAQALAGGVHGFDGYFPAQGKATKSYDTSFAMALGGGVDLAVSKHIWIRAVQADYFYTELLNRQSNRQNQFRISGGVVIRFPHWLWERQ